MNSKNKFRPLERQGNILEAERIEMNLLRQQSIKENCEPSSVFPAQPNESNAPAQNVGTQTNCYPWFQSRSKLNRLEIRAALFMLINVLPVLLCTFPLTLNSIVIYWCIRLQKTNCSILFKMNPYLRDLVRLHTFYTPIMYMTTSREFHRALIHLIQKWKT